MSGRKIKKGKSLDYNIIFNAITNLMAFTEFESGRILDVNNAWIQATGISRESACGMNALELGLWTSQSEREACIAELKRKGKIVDFEVKLIMKSIELTFLVSAELVEIEGKKYALWEFRDISEIKRMNEVLIKNEAKVKSLLAESEQSRRVLLGILEDEKLAKEALSKNEEIFRCFMEYSPIYVFFKDENIRSQRLSKNYESMLGKPISELLGKNMDELFPSELAKKMVEDDKKILKEGKQITVEEEFNGRFYTTIKFPIYINGKQLYLAGYTIDITDRRQAEEKILQSLREKETLIRELYHRTKNTMQVVRSILLLQAVKYPANTELQQLIKNTEDRIQAISLVHQMLYKSQDLSQISIKDYIYELSSLIMKSFSESLERISLNIKVDDQYFLLDTAVPFGLILNELMTNSLKYAFPDNRKGIINISLTKMDPATSILHYSDNGIGVPAEFNFRNQNTLGLKLIHGIGEEQLLGKVVMENKNGINCMLEFSNKFYKSRL